MRTKRRQTLDDNNNTVVDKVSIDLDSSTVFVGDIVWIKNDAVQYLTTPFIIEHFNGERIIVYREERESRFQPN